MITSCMAASRMQKQWLLRHCFIYASVQDLNYDMFHDDDYDYTCSANNCFCVVNPIVVRSVADIVARSRSCFVYEHARDV